MKQDSHPPFPVWCPPRSCPKAARKLRIVWKETVCPETHIKLCVPMSLGHRRNHWLSLLTCSCLNLYSSFSLPILFPPTLFWSLLLPTLQGCLLVAVGELYCSKETLFTCPFLIVMPPMFEACARHPRCTESGLAARPWMSYISDTGSTEHLPKHGSGSKWWMQPLPP